MIALEFTTFLGRFHPILVHLPIGFLVLAILLEAFESLRRTETKSRLIPIAWLLGGIGAAAAALCGWYLGETGLYKEDVLFVHRWLGIALVAISFVGWWLKRPSDKVSPWIQNGFNLVVLGMLFYEGHQGGNMTHGEDYLTQYAPASVKNMLGAENKLDSLPEFGNPDSVLVYNDLVQPIFEAKCFTCHNNEVQRGGLNMASPDSLMKGSQGDPIVVAGNPAESELFKRITLPQRNIKFMPPTEDPLTYDEIKVVEWWIDTGASFEDHVSAVTVNESMKPVLMRRYGLNTEPRPWYETVQLTPLDSTRIKELRQTGFIVKSLGATNPLLDVSYKGNDLNEARLQKLEPVKDYVTWLSLAGTNVKDEWLSTVAKLENLTRLELEKTIISDEGVAQLTELQHLEALNLYGTQITDTSLAHIEKIPGLKRVYLWSTDVSPQIAESTQEKKDGLEIIMGHTP
jgi:uncharacterized membrane protein